MMGKKNPTGFYFRTALMESMKEYIADCYSTCLYMPKKEIHQTRYFLYLHILHESVSFNKPFYILNNEWVHQLKEIKPFASSNGGFFPPSDGFYLLTSSYFSFSFKKTQQKQTNKNQLNLFLKFLVGFISLHKAY